MCLRINVREEGSGFDQGVWGGDWTRRRTPLIYCKLLLTAKWQNIPFHTSKLPAKFKLNPISTWDWAQGKVAAISCSVTNPRFLLFTQMAVTVMSRLQNGNGIYHLVYFDLMLTQPRRFVVCNAPFPIFYLNFIFITKEIRGLSSRARRFYWPLKKS